MGNVLAHRKKKISTNRKIAMGTWETCYDPSVYGTLQVRADKLMTYIEQFRAKTGRKLTVTHVVTKALALALKECPDANGIVRWNQVYLREHVDISVLVMLEEDGELDLSATKITDVDKKTLLELIDAIETQVKSVRSRQDKVLEQTRQTMRAIPAVLMNAMFKLLAFVIYQLNLDMSRFGIPKDAFGGAVVTSIGPLGLDLAYPPLVPYSHVPIFVAPGEVKEAAVVENGQLKIGKILNISATFDHRLVDGAHCSLLAKTFRKVLENPYEHLDPI